MYILFEVVLAFVFALLNCRNLCKNPWSTLLVLTLFSLSLNKFLLLRFYFCLYYCGGVWSNTSLTTASKHWQSLVPISSVTCILMAAMKLTSRKHEMNCFDTVKAEKQREKSYFGDRCLASLLFPISLFISAPVLYIFNKHTSFYSFISPVWLIFKALHIQWKHKYEFVKRTLRSSFCSCGLLDRGNALSKRSIYCRVFNRLLYLLFT